MIDVRRLRTDLTGAKASMARRGIDTSDLDKAAELDAKLRDLSSKRDDLRARVKSISKEVADARRAGNVEKAESLADESRAMGEQEQVFDAASGEISRELNDTLLGIPNFPGDDCPDGASEHDNVIMKVMGFDPDSYKDSQRVPHWEIGSELGILDVERATKLSGSMFVMYRGMGARLIRALVSFALDRHADAYEEIRPPTLVKTETMTATGHLPKFADEAYHVERDDLWAIPTAEVPLTSLARDEILAEADLPQRMAAYTSCYRREAGSAGRDTRGLLRVHEFDKVELLAYATPEQAMDVHSDIVKRAETLLEELGLAYRVLDLCTADIGSSSARTFDLETYAPGCDMWLEVSSVSWYSDYQARRANVRYKPASGGTAFVNTLNGSALAWPRIWATIVETYRQPNGSVRIPDVLQPYMGGTGFIERK